MTRACRYQPEDARISGSAFLYPAAHVVATKGQGCGLLQGTSPGYGGRDRLYSAIRVYAFLPG